MDSEKKNEVKKNMATGASTAAGATVGVVVGSVIAPNEAHAAEVSEPVVRPVHSPSDTLSVSPNSAPSPSEPEPTVEVVGYDRVTMDDSTQADIAVLNVNGHQLGVVDSNLDGMADYVCCDLNQNGVIEPGEIESVQHHNIPMQPLQEEAGFDLQYARNDIPDYVNDADVDTYLV